MPYGATNLGIRMDSPCALAARTHVADICTRNEVQRAALLARKTTRVYLDSNLAEPTRSRIHPEFGYLGSTVYRMPHCTMLRINSLLNNENR